jgi:ABC-type glycerol-3-phosphate transport system substrate-binding protein
MSGRGIMHGRVFILAAAIILAPLGAKAADLVVWWDEGYHAEEDQALRDIIAAFEQESGKEVELVFHSMEELPDKTAAALEAGQPPDFAFGFWLTDYASQWAHEGRLVDLSGTIGHFSDLFDPAQLDQATLLNATKGRRALYGLPIGQITHLTHVWKSLLEEAGSPLRTSRAIGKRIGPSGATRSSRRCDRRSAATTSGASGFRCRSKRLIPRMHSASSGPHTGRTT